MLYRFPEGTPHLTAKELASPSDSRPGSSDDHLDRLVRLLPILDDHVVLLWKTPPLPSQPVDVCFFRDKDGHPLLAVACESGLLWVLNADDPTHPDSVRVPGVGHDLPGIGRRRGRILGLWASNASRLLGTWTELLILVLPQRTTDQGPQQQLYRALVRLQEGRVQLRLTDEDADSRVRRSEEWMPVVLPAEFAWLAKTRLRLSSGADPFAPDFSRPSAGLRKIPRQSSQVTCSTQDTAWVEKRLLSEDRAGGNRR